MSDFSPILVLQIKICIKPDRHGEVAIKSEKLSPFGGIFPIMEQFDFKDADVIFSDNYFHLTGECITVSFKDEDIQAGIFENTEDVKARLCVRSSWCRRISIIRCWTLF